MSDLKPRCHMLTYHDVRLHILHEEVANIIDGTIAVEGLRLNALVRGGRLEARREQCLVHDHEELITRNESVMSSERSQS